jgi:hypothetical protein
MDEESDGRYSRAPQLEDVLALCKNLDEEGVRYVLIGGFAMILYGSVRGTKDVDLLIDPAPENVRALKRALARLPDDAAALIAEDDVTRYNVVRVADEIVVDLMAAACGVTWADLEREGYVRIEVEGVRIPVPTKGQLIRTKSTYRPTDAADVLYLSDLIEEERGQ